ncbi:MAG: RNA-binding protein [Bacteriovoracaceae bacterium]|nr:RNA-binding protein [Bacteriovoracaceae bacterium]
MNKITITGLSSQVTIDDLYASFHQFGDIKEIRIPKNKANLCRGLAFILFDNAESAHNAASEMDGELLHGDEVYVNVATGR